MSRSRFCGIVLLAGVCAALAPLQRDLHRLTGSGWQQESMTYLPRGDAVKTALLGFETTVAHYLWIRTVLYFGGHLLTDRQYPWIIDMVDIITRLCPWFYPAYEFAGVMIPDVCDNPAAARIILERGLTWLGSEKWNIAFYLGTIHLKYYDDRKTAAEYMARAALTPGAPRIKLSAMADAFYRQAGSPAEGLQFLLFSYETSDNPEVRRHIADKIAALHNSTSIRQ